MQKLMLAVAVVIVVAVAAPFALAGERTTIEFQLRGEEFKNHSSNEFPMTFLNKDLAAHDLPGFPEVVVFGKGDRALQKSLLQAVEKANRVLKRDIQANVDRKYFHELPAIGYRGETSEVMGVVKSLFGTVFHPEQGLQAARYGKRKLVFWKDFFGANAETRQMLEENGAGKIMKLWDDYDSNSDDILIMSDYGPQGDGTELIATVIRRCK